MNKNKIAVIDLSWVMHRYRHAYDSLSCTLNGKTIPTGHIYGTYTFVKGISQQYKKVILAIDSNSTYRKEILPTYKSNRKKNSGDEYADYDIHQDTNDILALCCSLSNVYYIKEEEFEADDIIGTLIRQADTTWDFYFHDDDILQNIGQYNLCVSFGKDIYIGPVTDRRSHIVDKYGIDKDYLPLLWKVVKGDSGDCIPIGIERFPSKILQELCLDERFNKNNVSFEECVDVITGYTKYSDKMKETVKQLRDKNSELYKKLETNYKLVKPVYLTSLRRQKMEADTASIFSKYNIRNV